MTFPPRPAAICSEHLNGGLGKRQTPRHVRPKSHYMSSPTKQLSLCNLTCHLPRAELPRCREEHEPVAPLDPTELQQHGKIEKVSMASCSEMRLLWEHMIILRTRGAKKLKLRINTPPNRRPSDRPYLDHWTPIIASLLKNDGISNARTTGPPTNQPCVSILGMLNPTRQMGARTCRGAHTAF